MDFSVCFVLLVIIDLEDYQDLQLEVDKLLYSTLFFNGYTITSFFSTELPLPFPYISFISSTVYHAINIEQHTKCTTYDWHKLRELLPRSLELNITNAQINDS